MSIRSAVEAALAREGASVASDGSSADGVSARVVDREGVRVGIVTLDRPAKLNALTKASWTRLRELIVELGGDIGLRAIVLRGRGERAFSAGADIVEFPVTRLGADRAREYNTIVSGAIDAGRAIPVPVIAMVDGLAVGGGCEIALTADICMAEEASRFGIPIGRLGVMLGTSELRSAVEVLGARWLMHMALSGSLLPAERALQLGIVHEVHPRERLVSRTAELVETIVACSPAAVRATKRLARRVDATSIRHDDAELRALEADVYSGDELRERIAAFSRSAEQRAHPRNGEGSRTA